MQDINPVQKKWPISTTLLLTFGRKTEIAGNVTGPLYHMIIFIFLFLNENYIHCPLPKYLNIN